MDLTKRAKLHQRRGEVVLSGLKVKVSNNDSPGFGGTTALSFLHMDLVPNRDFLTVAESCANYLMRRSSFALRVASERPTDVFVDAFSIEGGDYFPGLFRTRRRNASHASSRPNTHAALVKKLYTFDARSLLKALQELLLTCRFR